MAKYLEISEALKKEIIGGVYEKEGKIPTEHELVSRFSVSRQTIRQAIACLKNEGYLYQIQGSGTYISNPSTSNRKKVNSTPRVTVMCTYISDYIFPSIIRGIENKLSSNGISVNIVATSNRVEVERKILQRIINDGDIDGLIVEGTKTGFPNPNIELYKELDKLGIPYIFLHCSYPELLDKVTVGMKEREGGYQCIKKLIDMGCKTFGGIFKADDRQGLLRYKGFCEGLLDSSISLESAFVRWYTTEDLQSESRFSLPLIKGFEEPDGIVCYNDQVALYIINHFRENKLPLPRIASFDQSHLCLLAPDSVYSIGHRKEELGMVTAEKMINMLKGKEEESIFFDWLV